MLLIDNRLEFALGDSMSANYRIRSVTYYCDCNHYSFIYSFFFSLMNIWQKNLGYTVYLGQGQS